MLAPTPRRHANPLRSDRLWIADIAERAGQRCCRGRPELGLALRSHLPRETEGAVDQRIFRRQSAQGLRSEMRQQADGAA